METLSTFIVESKLSVHVSTFVISSEKEEVFWVSNLVSEKKANRFDALAATVNVISEEEVVGLRRVLILIEDAQKIVVLTVDITNNC